MYAVLTEKMVEDLVCCNCGKKGHLYRKCFYPTTSVGIICCHTPQNDLVFPSNRKTSRMRTRLPSNIANKLPDNLLFKMIRRKDSLAFAEFARGKFKVNDEAYIHKLLSDVTIDEFQVVAQAKEFDDIWYRLWTGKKTSKTRMNEYVRAKKKFDLLKAGIRVALGNFFSLSSILEKIEPKWESPEWGFPKGRRVPNESDLACAMREFTEETNINPDQITILPFSPVEETFVGSNGIFYKHVYFLAWCKSWVEPCLDPENRSQKAEVSAIRWFTPKEVLQHIRDDQPQRKELFLKVAYTLNFYLSVRPTEEKKEQSNE